MSLFLPGSKKGAQQAEEAANHPAERGESEGANGEVDHEDRPGQHEQSDFELRANHPTVQTENAAGPTATAQERPASALRPGHAARPEPGDRTVRQALQPVLAESAQRPGAAIIGVQQEANDALDQERALQVRLCVR